MVKLKWNCMDCYTSFEVDSETPVVRCPECGSTGLVCVHPSQKGSNNDDDVTPFFFESLGGGSSD